MIYMIHLCNFRQKLLILYVILPIRFFLRLGTKKSSMNYGLGENLTLSIFELLVRSVIYSMMGRTLVNLMPNII